MNNTTNSWEEKDPEPISAQIEEFRERWKEDSFYLSRERTEAWIIQALSTAHRNGVEEERERLLNQKANNHDQEVRKLAIAECIEIVEKMYSTYYGEQHNSCYEKSPRKMKKDILEALSSLTKVLH